MTTQNEGQERSLGQLVADATHDITSIVHSEIALAKAEIGADAKRVALGGGMFVVAGVLAFLALILLLFCAVYGLVAAGLAEWLAFLTVAGVLLLVCVILGLVGIVTFKRLNGKPERTIKSAQETVAALRPRSS